MGQKSSGGRLSQTTRNKNRRNKKARDKRRKNGQLGSARVEKTRLDEILAKLDEATRDRSSGREMFNPYADY
ncbi:MAG: hypothetical protein WCX71_02675 [Candidatus Buchananbacteria bacterium]